MSSGLLIYGATGFTGRLIVREALARGMLPLLGGRSQLKLSELGRHHGLDYRVAALEDAAMLNSLLVGVRAVLNVAGPFRHTARLLASACIDRGLHYLDISGEIPSIEEVLALDERARARGCMLLPGAGFDVVPSDCMALLASKLLPDADSLSIGLSGLTGMSRGSAETIFEQFAQPLFVRRAGKLVPATSERLEATFDFGSGPRRALAVSWGDVSSAYQSTRIPNITVYFEETMPVAMALGLKRYAPLFWELPLTRYWRRNALRLIPEGPTVQQQSQSRATVVARVANRFGREAEVRLETPEVYSFTATASVDLSERVLDGDFVPGFQTPARAYGPEYVLSLPGVVLQRAPENGHQPQ